MILRKSAAVAGDYPACIPSLPPSAENPAVRAAGKPLRMVDAF